MEAKDLRIGNYIMDSLINGNNPLEVHAIYRNLVMHEDTRIYNYEIRPIPLTEEWLLRFGFVEQSGRYGVFSKNRIRIAVKDGLGAIAYLIQEDTGNGCYIPNECKHVHSLQNLYFALTGEELTLQNGSI